MLKLTYVPASAMGTAADIEAALSAASDLLNAAAVAADRLGIAGRASDETSLRHAMLQGWKGAYDAKRNLRANHLDSRRLIGR